MSMYLLKVDATRLALTLLVVPPAIPASDSMSSKILVTDSQSSLQSTSRKNLSVPKLVETSIARPYLG